MLNNFEESLLKMDDKQTYVMCKEKMGELYLGDCDMCHGLGSYEDYDDYRDQHFTTPCFCLLEELDKV
tara:strand:- start:123 stop:326 length:204 start_codon:yes stop_codon:yes gene_type:complete